jgi:CelD/BcsL family acetyltransferase involved in cellulose biosynthesis
VTRPSADGVRVELVETLDRLDQVRAPYESLLGSAAPGRGFFYRVDMMRAMSPAFLSTRRSPFVLLAWQGDALRGVLPLVLEKKPWTRAGVRRLGFWGSDAGAISVEGEVPIQGDPALCADAFHAAMCGPLSHRFDVLDLRYFRADSTALPAFRQAFESATWEAESMISHGAIVPATIEEFKAPRSSSRLRELGRMQRRLNERYSVDLRVESTLSATARDEVMALHMRRQGDLASEGHRRESVFSAKHTRTALTNLLTAAEQAGCARHYLLYADEGLIAFLLTFREGGTQLAYLTAFDADFHLYGPGSLVFWEALRTELALGAVQRIDYGVGTTQVKALFGIETLTPQRMLWLPPDAPLSRLRHASWQWLTRSREWYANRRTRGQRG